MKLYIETTVPNFLFADDALEKREITKLFAQWLRLGPHEIHTSELVFAEIARAQAPLRARLEQALEAMQPKLLPVTEEARKLAQDYLKAGILASRFKDDLLHVATAVCHRMDMVVTWNMKHLAHPGNVVRVNAVNRLQGWPMIRVHTPKEVLGL
jgi:predicted nucleic acid-binding protein